MIALVTLTTRFTVVAYRDNFRGWIADHRTAALVASWAFILLCVLVML